ncbi:MAG: hypothetical protein MUO76_17745 [Anaerolineaceae bacterium]|nr:hypothetical protein [Anaerolineaceae bacterium]
MTIAQIVVVRDNDGPGRRLGKARAAMLHADLVFPPEGWKDIDSWILAVGQTEASKLLCQWVKEEDYDREAINS